MTGRSRKLSASTRLALIGTAILLVVFIYQAWGAARQPATRPSGNPFFDLAMYAGIGLGGLVFNANTRPLVVIAVLLVVASWLPVLNRQQ